MLKITGLDKLQKELKQAQDALDNLDGELGVVSFNPEDPASIDQAISQVEQIIDQRVAGLERNPIVASFVEQMKEQYREGILEKAAEARLEGDE